MTHTRTSTLIRVVFLALLATVASVGLLSAEDYRGKFTLPFETKWGGATLPPGDYTLQLNTGVPPYTVRVSGDGAGAFISTWDVSNGKGSGRSSLIIVRNGPKGTVLALQLADRGMVFTYRLPKGERQMLAQKPELFQRLLIVASAK